MQIKQKYRLVKGCECLDDVDAKGVNQNIALKKIKIVMEFFVNILSEATPIMECTFKSLNQATKFFNQIVSGYSLSGDEYEISLGCYLIDIEEEFIYMTCVVGEKESTVDFFNVDNYNTSYKILFDNLISDN